MKRRTIVTGALSALAATAGGARAQIEPFLRPSIPYTGPRSVLLAGGKIESLPQDGDLVATIERCAFDNAKVTERHYSAIEYAISGAPALRLGDGYRVTLRPGDAMWIPPLTTHTHETATLETATTWVFAMRPVSGNTISNGCSAIFRSETISAPRVQRYYESLTRIALPANFTIAPIAIDAMQTFAVAAGNVTLRIDESDTRNLDAGNATFVAPLHRYELSSGTAAATVLVYAIYGDMDRPSA